MVALTACASRRPPPLPRVATDLPDRFLEVLLDAAGSETTAEPTGNLVCRTPIVDPRHGLHLELQRSTNGVGDYAVETGRYGVRAGELLRVDCATGRAIGIVSAR